MRVVVLDAEAVKALCNVGHRAHRRIIRYLEAARRLQRPVVVPTVVLAELYRTRERSAMIDAGLSRAGEALTFRDTDRQFARYVGSTLGAAGASSELLADAHVASAAAEAGGGVVITSEPDDLERLCAPYRFVAVESM